jgi:threonine dehydrogenase-like Zn-dependent dehydrogenase
VRKQASRDLSVLRRRLSARVRLSSARATTARARASTSPASLDGRLKLDELITHRLTLGDINAGFEGMERREVTRAVVVFQGARRGPRINRP